MDNKLSELSKPVAWILGTPACKHLTTDEEYANWYVEKMSTALPLYSQEYVSALQHESAVNWEAAASLNVENQDLKKRIAELEEQKTKWVGWSNELGAKLDAAEKRLATPVRLPNKNDVEFWFGSTFQVAKFDRAVERAISAAGFKFVGDE
ncbi:hypothetical protein OI978_24335 [Serratia nevei]|uniref:hypothetical protein n=1 Tax=Serratia nevei TaxID=2703794 RepID=UPI002543D307|nr:hypothetical protein [Serratia nevei]WIJ63896.1 hypothetical protein OI978_24335 [Serratia nevei]